MHYIVMQYLLVALIYVLLLYLVIANMYILVSRVVPLSGQLCFYTHITLCVHRITSIFLASQVFIMFGERNLPISKTSF